ncbi:hypothetical protein M427DRAFT_53253 [Gonapodya prolifera JEL478]|uniref:Uncharacterized protein n=1 Tax=Gonapodya prolifera (strain JEL478) TaxID=1344416 RepID=A0A139AS72_GONPJ|nr:hypothetical protein M427DRAFT_53253 [Gonapodya prolifera JEL478]|eukprot:KXS19315.1 hypothetical protein M427DRAFT_53253 [Gonapodya prolifera JEL478]
MGSNRLRGPPRWPTSAALVLSLVLWMGLQQEARGQTQCLSLSQSTACTGWTTASVNVSSSWTTTTFDSYMMTWADSPAHIQDFNDAYGCSWDGTGIRYALSYGCAERIFLSDSVCTSAPVSAALNPLCASTCQSYLSSVTAVLAACPATGSAYVTGKTVTTTQTNLRQATLNYISKFCTTYAQSTATCQTAVAMDSGNCGFFDRPASATASCSANSTQTCCSTLNGKTFSATISTGTKGGLSTTTVIIIGIGAAVAVVIVVGLGIFLYRRRNARKNAAYMRNVDSGYGGNDRDMDTKTPYNNMGNGAAQRNGIPMSSMNNGPGGKNRMADGGVHNASTSAFMNQVRSNGPDWEPVGWQTDRGAAAGGPPQMVSATAAAYARGYEQETARGMDSPMSPPPGNQWATDNDYGTTSDERDVFPGGRAHSDDYHGDRAAMLAADPYEYQKGYNEAPKEGTKRKSSKRKSVVEGGSPSAERSGSKKHSRKKSDASRKGGSGTKQSRRRSTVNPDEGGDGREKSTRRASSRQSQSRHSYYEADDRQRDE